MSTPLSAIKSAAADVLIVGAGPAGATASLFLGQAHIPHTLIDKATFPREKADGNVYGSKVIEILDRLNPNYFPELMAQAEQTLGCSTAHIFTPNGERFTLNFAKSPVNGAKNHAASPAQVSDDIPFFTMNRRHFDNFLVNKLDHAYVDLHFGTTITALERQETQWQVTLETSGQTTHLTPKLIIAADGAKSSVVQQLGLMPPIERYYDSVQGYFRGVTGFEQTEVPAGATQAGYASHIEAHFLPTSNPGFFFIAPLTNGIFNVGVGKPRRDVQQQNMDLHQVVEAVIRNHPKLAARFTHSEPVSDLRPWPEIVGALGRVPVSGPGYLIVGDAAGLCNPLTCFGTGNAMISGMLAAQQVKQSVTQQRFDGATLNAYDQALYQRLQREFQIGNLLKKVTQRDWLFNLVTSNRPVRSLLRQSFQGTLAMLQQL